MFSKTQPFSCGRLKEYIFKNWQIHNFVGQLELLSRLFYEYFSEKLFYKCFFRYPRSENRGFLRIYFSRTDLTIIFHFQEYISRPNGVSILTFEEFFFNDRLKKYFFKDQLSHNSGFFKGYTFPDCWSRNLVFCQEYF